MLPPGKGFPGRELEQRPGAELAMVGAELKISQGTKIGKRGTGDVGVYQAQWGRRCKSLLKTHSPAECQSQTTENTGHLTRALQARCFALALSFPTMNVSPGRVRTNVILGG